ncbi:B12 binding domain protein [Polystyrenella longa]|uniref:B12 binding domain protein n=1 Tax=Polystyrenella longa TaxID=2528007 RepID=A0A518CK63_9PLAN|nr:cobalamin B12-binding domain-containing protein [Polystyrenella longa]QDU79615.1 B12 binding domain protein [Polystyrenella longa]
MNLYFSTKEVATALGVSQSSIKRWCDAGDLEMVQTSGGHRRVSMTSLIQFLRQSQRLLVEPKRLGLPVVEPSMDINYEREREQFKQALIQSDEDAARAVVLRLYLRMERISVIGDELIAPVFTEIGNLWDCGDIQIYEERRCCEICSRILREIRSYQPILDENVPRAIGATPPGDVYSLPVGLVELVLREQGWQALSYGCEIPLRSMERVINEQKPRLAWLSVSFIQNRETFLNEYASLAATALNAGTIIVVGGQGLSPEMRRKMDYYMYGDTLRHFELFASLCYQSTKATSEASRQEMEAVIQSFL